MYSKKEATLVRTKFWTSFGQYMKPIVNANGDTTNWLNYKTGVKGIYFRMDAGTQQASIAIEVETRNEESRQTHYKQFLSFRDFFEEQTGEVWNWEEAIPDEHGILVSHISKTMAGVNVFREEDWPAIISFLKPRLIALDAFWQQVKAMFEP